MTRLTAIRIHPVKGEPSVDLSVCQLQVDGLAGDRRKKAPVHIVSEAESQGVRANLILDLSPADLVAAIGGELDVGECRLHVRSGARDCPGVYADVAQTGTLRVGDPVDVSTRR